MSFIHVLTLELPHRMHLLFLIPSTIHRRQTWADVDMAPSRGCERHVQRRSGHVEMCVLRVCAPDRHQADGNWLIFSFDRAWNEELVSYLEFRLTLSTASACQYWSDYRLYTGWFGAPGVFTSYRLIDVSSVLKPEPDFKRTAGKGSLATICSNNLESFAYEDKSVLCE